jgi:hypothetical protein
MASQPWLSGVLALGLTVAGCGGFGPRNDSGTMQIDLSSIVGQMGGAPSGSRQSPASVSTPGDGVTTSVVTSIILGAIVIDFQNTPIGPKTPITKNLEDSLAGAAQRSVAFITIVQLPSSDSSVQVVAPPPETPNWQVFAIGTRNTISQLTDVNENSPIYYGFNVDAAGNPFFISGNNAPATVNVKVLRACIANTPPLGCAQYLSLTQAAVTTDVEIIGIYKNGGGPNLLGGAGPGTQVVGTSRNGGGASASSVISIITTNGTILSGLSGATSVQVDTTHQEYPGNSNACRTANGATLLGTQAGQLTSSGCQVESYFTNF